VVTLAVGIAAVLLWIGLLWASRRRLGRTGRREREGGIWLQLQIAPWSDRHVGSLLARDPCSPALLSQHVKNAAERSDWPEAVRRAEIFLARAPRSPQAWLAHANALRGAKRDEESLAQLRKALRRMPRDPEILIAWAREAMRRRDWAEAAQRFQRLRRHHPDRYEGYDQAATALSEDGRFDEAEALIAEGKQRTNHWTMWQAAAKLAERAGDGEEAVRRWEALRARFPAEQAGYVHGAEALARFDRGEEAVALIRQARDFFPGNKLVANAAARLAPPPAEEA
jgi:predicted Zn-dependent protease